jgi:hypothetical protein
MFDEHSRFHDSDQNGNQIPRESSPPILIRSLSGIGRGNAKYREELIAYLKEQMVISSEAYQIKKREQEQLAEFLFKIPPDFEEAK